MRTLALAIVATFSVVAHLHAQSPAGKWLGATPDGGSLGLDLTVTGDAVTGTLVVIRDGQALPVIVQDGRLTGAVVDFRVAFGPEQSAFRAEASGDTLVLRTLAPEAQSAATTVTLRRVQALPDVPLNPLATTAPASAPSGWRAHNRMATVVRESDREFLRVDGRLGDGVIWRDGASLVDGAIEFDVRGRNQPGQSFVGVAFRGLDDATYDGIYFRPFNFKAAEPGRLRAVQFISHPDHPWDRLRKESPGRYESAITPVPDPDSWFHVRVVVDSTRVEVFVDGSTTPALTVETIAPPRGSMVGLWVGNGSGGDFANLRVTPK